MPINSEHLASLTDADVIDQNGDKVGGVGQIYLDDATGQPAWVSVKSGLFGLRESFAPLASAEVVNGNIQVPYTKDVIKDSPRIDAEHHLDDSQQARLYEHYGLERGAAPTTGVQGADRTASFGSEQVAQDLHDGRTDGEDEAEAEDERAADAQERAEYAGTDPTGDAAPASAEHGAGSTRDAAPPSAEYGAGPTGDGPSASGGPGSTTPAGAAAVGAAAAAGAGAPGQDAGVHPETTPSSRTSGWSEDHHAHYQRENPLANEDWAAEEAPEAPVSTEWSIPATDPADEEPTRVSRSGYSPDRPAAHSAAYEGHGAPPAAAAPFGSVEPVSAETADGAESVAGSGGAVESGIPDVGTDDTVTGAAHQTGTGYPSAAEEPDEVRGSESPVAGAAATGAAAGGIAVTDAPRAAYEVPGAEQGAPIVDTDPGAELAADREDPADGGTLPSEDTMEAGTDAGVDDTGEPDGFGPQGFQPDRDGTDMTDEERARLNQARGAL